MLIRPLTLSFGEFQERCTWRAHCVFFSTLPMIARAPGCPAPAAHSFLLNERSLGACAIILLIHQDYTEKALRGALRLLLFLAALLHSTDHMLACLFKSLFFRVICSAITRSAHKCMQQRKELKHELNWREGRRKFN